MFLPRKREIHPQIKVTKFSQCSSPERVSNSCNLAGPVGNGAYVTCFLLICHGSKWLNDKSAHLTSIQKVLGSNSSWNAENYQFLDLFLKLYD